MNESSLTKELKIFKKLPTFQHSKASCFYTFISSLSPLNCIIQLIQTGSEVNDDVDEKDGVREAIECNPPSTEVVVEEGNCHWQND